MRIVTLRWTRFIDLGQLQQEDNKAPAMRVRPGKRERDNRRQPLSNGGDAFRRTLGPAIAAPVSRQWKGCWERDEG